jgi:heme/copper-type cytochrome/quinol oxidase subunit 2
MLAITGVVVIATGFVVVRHRREEGGRQRGFSEEWRE